MPELPQAKSNKQNDEIYKFLNDVGQKMRLAGDKPNTDFVYQEEKANSLCKHSEKLAVAFGILNLNEQLSILVYKNLRICSVCHSALLRTDIVLVMIFGEIPNPIIR
ncbi:Pentatricopeptide repeat [Quillaja saponaria]|uniref:Pentatricopeptide repeat n=1 Tax=Quillaja saponaria TaxID=32244 RepID=A0AAD7PZC1_QUISA|nr:Pentatricopeptide repeat [Quillaja saponaria]